MVALKRPSLLSPARLLLLAAAAALVNAATSQSPPITAWVRTTWPAPPIVLEAVEHVSQEKSTDIFSILTHLIPTPLLATLPASEAYPALLSALSSPPSASARFLPHPASTALLKLSLAIHATAPRIQTHYQFYETAVLPAFVGTPGFEEGCEAWVDWYGVQGCGDDGFRVVAGVEGGNFDFEKIR
ncbi:hypothetical protein BDK51DRAFT_48953 [Blyttiomyces helicus]|uniref:UGGT thioredoxin-like domain-containing protein n=1 Tax=Blyttiomyces helicus TaxID=388810 RepID=A0A4P9VXP1_9FUNG|nr:hypothetical protein BDK51DRAFT_48953 [Blyttiomyces helicus]|eukprot:RKO84504.1 hypothetical protein BDK51DRAFT_48953 [Blyttiomyces helicus]